MYKIIFGNKITSTNVMLIKPISSDSERKTSIMCSLQECLALARQENKELIQVSIVKETNIPVCIIEDLGKYKYTLSKKKKPSQQNNKSDSLKEITLKILIDQNDLNIKIGKVKDFLSEMYRVRIVFKRLLRFQKKRIENIEELEKKIVETISNAVKDDCSSFSVDYQGAAIRIEMSPKGKKCKKS